MRNNPLSLIAASLMGTLACLPSDSAKAQTQDTSTSGYIEPLDAGTLQGINALFRKLIDAENNHDLPQVRAMLWNSPSTLFVAKTATAAESNWAGFWGFDVVSEHFNDLYQGTFVMAPDYQRVKTVGLTSDVAVTYAPVSISVEYAGQTPIPKPFLIILNWIRTPAGWRIATDIALPIPPAPHS